jgi:hypothetical protein
VGNLIQGNREPRACARFERLAEHIPHEGNILQVLDIDMADPAQEIGDDRSLKRDMTEPCAMPMRPNSIARGRA